MLAKRRHKYPDPATHIDGSLCPEGTANMPVNRRVCCKEFEWRTYACYYDVRYEWQRWRGQWVIAIAPDAGGGGIAIRNCPHCGAKLPGRGKSGRWFDFKL